MVEGLKFSAYVSSRSYLESGISTAVSEASCVNQATAAWLVPLRINWMLKEQYGLLADYQTPCLGEDKMSSAILTLPGTGGSYRIKGFTLCHTTALLGHLPAKDC